MTQTTRFPLFPSSKRFFLVAAFALMLLSALAEPSNATWNRIATFNTGVSSPGLPLEGYVSCSWFFNPGVGLVGMHWNNTTTNNGAIKWTTDGGQTWTNATVPTLINHAI